MFHFDEESKAFKAVYFEKAYISYIKAMSKSGIKQKGFYEADRCIVRIPTNKEITASVGDYIHLGRGNSEMPDRTKDLKITQISDNRIGGSPHIRVYCGG